MRIFENFEFQNYKFLEDDGSRDDLGKSPNGVLGVVSGPSFFLNGYSRNGRFYPKEAWESAVSDDDFKRKLNRGLVFGCIGHPENYTLDELLASGKVSHKIKEIKIDKKTGQGIAKYEILDTPAGRILNTVLRSGSNLYVSTRAFGSFKENETVEKNGKKFKVISPKDFKLESIDFVIEPGFLETDPKLMEELKEDLSKVVDTSDGIFCKDGLCGLESLKEKLNENKKVENMEKKFEKLKKLDKDSLIEMIKNISLENKELRNNINEGTYQDFTNTVQSNNTVNNDTGTNSDPTNTPDDENGKKSQGLELFIAYIELLMRAVKWNEKYNKFYDKLVDFLDKKEIKETDINNIKNVLENMLKIKDIDYSVEKIIEKLLNTEIIFSDIKQEFFNMFSKYEKTILDIAEKLEDKEKEIKNKSILIENLQKGIEKISEKALENSKEKIVEKIIEKEIFVEDENIKEENKKLKENILEKEKILENTKEKYNNVKKEFNDLKEDHENKIISLEESINSLKEKYEKSLKEKEENISSLNKLIQESKIKYYKLIYPIEESDIKDVLNKYKSEKEISEQLKRKEKFYKQNNKYLETKEEIIGEKASPKRKILAEKLI